MHLGDMASHDWAGQEWIARVNEVRRKVVGPPRGPEKQGPHGERTGDGAHRFLNPSACRSSSRSGWGTAARAGESGRRKRSSLGRSSGGGLEQCAGLLGKSP